MTNSKDTSELAAAAQSSIDFSAALAAAGPGKIMVTPPGTTIGDPVYVVQRPSMGRIVIFHDAVIGQASPAVVQKVNPDNSVNCHVMPDNGMPFGAQKVPLHKPGGLELQAWTWPERT